MKIITIALLMIILSANLYADEERKSNPDAIPPVISPNDPDMKLSAREHISVLNAKKADHVTKGILVGGKPMANNSEQRTRERIHRAKIDANPRQTIPLRECIKPNGIIDSDVNECMNGRMKKTW